MRKAIFGLLSVLVINTAVVGQEEQIETVDLDKVILGINEGLERAQGSLVGLQIESAEVTFKTVRDKEGGGGFKLFAKASKEWQRENASSVTYKFQKPKKEKAMELVQSNALAAALAAAGDQYLKSAGEIDGLEKDGFTIVVSISVKNSNAGGVEFEIFGVGVDAGVDWSKKVVHTIKLTMKPAV